MRFAALASAAFAVIGTTPSLISIPEGNLSAPEPMWLALWGLALIGFSTRLRARTRVADQPAPESDRRTMAGSPLDAMHASVARSI